MRRRLLCLTQARRMRRVWRRDTPAIGTRGTASSIRLRMRIIRLLMRSIRLRMLAKHMCQQRMSMGVEEEEEEEEEEAEAEAERGTHTHMRPSRRHTLPMRRMWRMPRGRWQERALMSPLHCALRPLTASRHRHRRIGQRLSLQRLLSTTEVLRG
jgi:hypothetical protein